MGVVVKFPITAEQKEFNSQMSDYKTVGQEIINNRMKSIDSFLTEHNNLFRLTALTMQEYGCEEIGVNQEFTLASKRYIVSIIIEED